MQERCSERPSPGLPTAFAPVSPVGTSGWGAPAVRGAAGPWGVRPPRAESPAPFAPKDLTPTHPRSGARCPLCSRAGSAHLLGDFGGKPVGRSPALPVGTATSTPRGHEATCDPSCPGAYCCLEPGTGTRSPARVRGGTRLGLYCGPGSCRWGCCPQASPERARPRQPRESWGQGPQTQQSFRGERHGRRVPPGQDRGARGKLSPTWQLCPSLPVPGGWPAPSPCPLFTRVRGRAGPAPPSHVKLLGPEPAPGATKGPCPLRSFLRRCPWGLLPSLRRMGVSGRTLAPLWALALALACAQHTGKAPTERLPGLVPTWQPRGPPHSGAALGPGGWQTAWRPGPRPGEAGRVCERLLGWTRALAFAVLWAPACGFGDLSGAAGAHVGEGPPGLSRSPEEGERNPSSLSPPTASPAGGHTHPC